MWDFIIVGGGITGLAIGALLAHDRKKVLVLEKTGKLGGRAQIWEKDGFTVDYGIHGIRYGPKSAISKTCRELGVEIPYVSLGPSYVKDEDGKVKIFPTGPVGFLRSEMFTFMERLNVFRVMLRVRRKSFETFKNLSVKESLDEEGIKGGMRRYLHLVSASMMVCPFIEKTSIREMLVNLQKVLRKRISVMYPLHGWKPIYDLLTSTIKNSGEIRLQSKVDSVDIEKGAVRGVHIGKDFIEGKEVVVSVPCQEYFGAPAVLQRRMRLWRKDGSALLDEKLFPTEFVKMCKSMIPSSGVSIDYGLSRRVSSSDGLWYFWSPMSFGMFTSNLCPELAPPGKQLLTWFYPTTLEDMQDPQRAKASEEELERAIYETFPGIQDAIEWRRAIHLKTVNGAQVNVNQTRDRRPGFRAPGIQGLYFVGDSTGASGAGGDIGHESVHECYKAITS